MTLVELSRQLMGHGFACLGESDGSWFQQGEAGWFASGIPHPCANTVLSAGPDWNYASLAEIAGHFHARGVPCSWLCWPDQQPLEQGQHLLALGYRPVAAAALMAAPTAALLATTPNPGQRLAAALPGAELLPLGPSFPAGLRRLCFRQHRRTSGLWSTRRRSPARIRHGRFPTHLWRSPRRRAVGGGHLGGGRISGRDFLGGNPAGLAAVWIGSGRHCSSNRRRCSPRRTPHPVAGRRQR